MTANRAIKGYDRTNSTSDVRSARRGYHFLKSKLVAVRNFALFDYSRRRTKRIGDIVKFQRSRKSLSSALAGLQEHPECDCHRSRIYSFARCANSAANLFPRIGELAKRKVARSKYFSYRVCYVSSEERSIVIEDDIDGKRSARGSTQQGVDRLVRKRARTC